MLPLRVRVDVGAVVVEKVTLNLRLAWSIEESILIGPEVRVIEFDIRVIAYMTGFGGLER
jgi:hypothetical protein